MARWEDEDVSGLNIPDPFVSVVKLIGKQGKDCNDERSAYIKTISTTMPDKSVFVKHYVRFYRGELVDPHATDSNLKSKIPEFKKVSEDCYKFYLKYLNTKNRLYFTRSRRLYMEN